LDVFVLMLGKVTYLDCICYMWDEHYCDINTHLCNSHLICHDIWSDKSDVSQLGTGYVILQCKRFVELIMDNYLTVFLSRSFFPYCLGENGYIIQITSWEIFKCPHEVREYHCKKLQTNHISLSSTLVIYTVWL
jgi:hypothetical protein